MPQFSVREDVYLLLMIFMRKKFDPKAEDNFIAKFFTQRICKTIKICEILLK